MAGKLYFVDLENNPIISQLQQLTCVTSDTDIISRKFRDDLLASGLAIRVMGGWNIITPKGIEYLDDLGFIKA